MGVAKEPATFNDGRKVSQAIYDYCSYDSGKHTFKITVNNYLYVDWAMKRSIFINLLLRAYSQEIFTPTEIYGTGCSKDDFVDEVSAVFKDLRIQYNQISL